MHIYTIFSKMRYSRCVITLIMGVWAFGVCAADVTVFAAASMKAPLDVIIADYEESSGNKVVLSLAGSSVLARQIEYGAPADVFISANQQWMDHIANVMNLGADKIATIATNHLVIASQGAGAMQDITDLQPKGKIAVPLISAVPLGVYARQALLNLNLLDQFSPYLLQTDNALTARRYVETGQAPMAILYASDVVQSHNLYVLAQFPPASHDKVRYQAAALRIGAAQGFVEFLQGKKAQAIFAEMGYKAE